MLGKRGYRCMAQMVTVTRATPAIASKLSLAARRQGERWSCLGVLPLPAVVPLCWPGSRMICYLPLRSRLGRNHSQPDRYEDGLGTALDIKLCQNMPHMEFD